MGEFVRVARDVEVGERSVRCVAARGVRVALFRLDGELHALDDECSHEWASLSEGTLCGDEIECPLHAGRFEIRTGRATTNVAPNDLRRFRVRVVDGEIEIEV